MIDASFRLHGHATAAVAPPSAARILLARGIPFTIAVVLLAGQRASAGDALAHYMVLLVYCGQGCALAARVAWRGGCQQLWSRGRSPRFFPAASQSDPRRIGQCSGDIPAGDLKRGLRDPRFSR